MTNTISSIPGSHTELPGTQHTFTSSSVIEGSLVSLVHIVNANLQAIKQQMDQLQVIIRYDSLPIVQGNEAEWYQLFNLMLHSIIAHPPADSKLFIYIRCELQKGDVMNLQVQEGFRPLIISVYTNIITDAAWQQLHKKDFEICGEIINKIKGNFTCHEIENTGCLFDIELNGKLN